MWTLTSRTGPWKRYGAPSMRSRSILTANQKPQKEFIRDNLTGMCRHGAAMIRLDAFAYATKKAGTSCFFIEPDIWDLLDECTEILKPYHVEILPEIHEHYTMQKKIEEKGYYVYDFALPMLLINALYYGQTGYLKSWLEICPRKQFTTLDTHDGIGVVDVKDLLPDEEINRTKEDIFKYGANVKKIYNTAAYNNLDIYQVNCTYYSALGRRRQGISSGKGGPVLRTGHPSGILRGAYGGKERSEASGRDQGGQEYQPPLLYGRRDCGRSEAARGREADKADGIQEFLPAFDDSFEMQDCEDGRLVIVRKSNGYTAQLDADF